MSDRETVVVLGWDGLDYELATEWGLADAFGEYHREIDTFDNPVLDEPHTRELWPSIITGLPPAEHGIHAAQEGDGIQWDSTLAETASSIAQGVVPQSLRSRIGKALRDRGAEVQQYDRDYYDERGIETIFDGRASRAISIPNYRCERDELLDVGIDRTAIWRDVLRTVDDADRTLYRPLVSEAALEEQLAEKMHRRLGIVEAARRQPLDIVFVWLGYLDTVGHLDPMVSEGFQRRHYREAARVTRELRERARVVCVSDHGLRDGRHTHSPMLASDERELVDRVSSVLEFAAGFDAVYPRGQRGEDGVAERRIGETGGAREVEEQLEQLGYL